MEHSILFHSLPELLDFFRVWTIWVATNKFGYVVWPEATSEVRTQGRPKPHEDCDASLKTRLETRGMAAEELRSQLREVRQGLCRADLGAARAMAAHGRGAPLGFPLQRTTPWSGA